MYKKKHSKSRRKRATDSRYTAVDKKAEELKKSLLSSPEVSEKIRRLQAEVDNLSSRLKKPAKSPAELREQFRDDNTQLRVQTLERELSELKVPGSIGGLYWAWLWLGVYVVSMWIWSGLAMPKGLENWLFMGFCFFGPITWFVKWQERREKRTAYDSLWIELRALTHPLNEKVNAALKEEGDRRRQDEQTIREHSLEISAWKKIKRDLDEEEREKRKRERKELLKAQADAYRGGIRDQSETIKRRLEVTDDCPYCGGPLGSDYHADHIYPVAKGGLSTSKNMVNVCSACNIKKRDLTLRQFCEKNNIDEATVARRLKALRKEY